MKVRFFLMCTAAALLAACSAGNPALRTAQMQSELSLEESGKANFANKKIEHAKADLDSSKKAEELKDDQLALVMAELSNLRYRVVFAEAARDSAKAENTIAKQALAEDETRLKSYNEILMTETKGGK